MEDKLVQSEDQLQLPPHASVDDVVLAIRHIFSKPHIQRVTIEPGRPISVVWHRRPGQTIESLPAPMTAMQVLSNIRLEEMPSVVSMEGKPQHSPHEVMVTAMNWVCGKGLYPTHILLNRRSVMRRWLGIPPNYPLYNKVLGMDVLVDDDIYHDSFVILGCRQKVGSYQDAVYALKVNMETPSGS